MNNHPIQPSPELREQMWEMSYNCASIDAMCELAFQAGADCVRRLEAASLKEQALAVLDGRSNYLDETQTCLIRRALEALPNDN